MMIHQLQDLIVKARAIFYARPITREIDKVLKALDEAEMYLSGLKPID